MSVASASSRAAALGLVLKLFNGAEFAVDKLIDAIAVAVKAYCNLRERTEEAQKVAVTDATIARLQVAEDRYEAALDALTEASAALTAAENAVAQLQGAKA